MTTYRDKRRRLVYLVTFLTASFVLICLVTLLLARNAIMGDRREPKSVLVGVTVDTLVELPGDRAYPEAITVGPDGNIYVSSFCTGVIWRVTPAGDYMTWYEGDDVSAASGLAFGADGSLYVADIGDCNPRSGAASLKRVLPDQMTVETVGDINETDIPNGLAFDRDGVLYLTDTQHGNVRRLNDENRFETWWELPDVNDNDARPTGLAYDPLTDTLLVTDTESGSVYRIGFDAERNPLEEQILFRNNDRELDGLTLDDQGRVFLTLFDVNKIAILEPDGNLNILAEDFREPSDIAYLDGVLYVTNFDSLSLTPLIGWLIDPSLPFTVSVVTLPSTEG